MIKGKIRGHTKAAVYVIVSLFKIVFHYSFNFLKYVF